MSLNQMSDQYRPYFKKAPIDKYFKKNCKTELVTSFSRFKELINGVEGKLVAFDSETKGLDFSMRNPIVGFSISFDSLSGFYVPLRHIVGVNIQHEIEDRTKEWSLSYLNSLNFEEREKMLSLLKSNREEFLNYVSGYLGSQSVQHEIFEIGEKVCLGSRKDLDSSEVFGLLFEFLKRNTVLMYNSIFDLKMLMEEGLSIEEVRQMKVFEVMSLIFNADTNVKGIGLKKSAVYYLGRSVPSFEDTVKGYVGFENISPEQGYQYACYDTANTFGLFSVLYPMLKNECMETLKRDNRLVVPMIEYMTHPLTIDREFMEAGVFELTSDINEIRRNIRNCFELPVNVDSRQKVAKILTSLNLDTGERTETGLMKLDEESLGNLSDELNRLFDDLRAAILRIKPECTDLKKEFSDYTDIDLKKLWKFWNELGYFEISKKWQKKIKERKEMDGKYLYDLNKGFFYQLFIDENLADSLIKYQTLSKQGNTYLSKMAARDEGRLQYNIFGTASGRLSSGNRNNPYYLKINAQNLTKPNTAHYLTEFIGEDQEDCVLKDGEDYIVLGWRFKLVDNEFMENNPDLKYVEGADPFYNVRRAIIVPNRNDWYYVSIDYSQQELRVAGGLSNDPVFINTYAEGGSGDLHTQMAIQMFGEEKFNENRSKYRKKAKIANFGLQYGGNTYTLVRNNGLPEEEAEEIYRSYMEATANGLQRWKKEEVEKALQNNGVIYSAFGRPRRLGHYLFNSDPKKVAFGERSVASHLIQGTCGDVLRIVLADLYHKILKDNSNVRFALTVHDQIDFYIKKDFFKEVVPQILDIMNIEVPGSSIPLESGVEVGYSYGITWAFLYDERKQMWIPE